MKINKRFIRLFLYTKSNILFNVVLPKHSPILKTNQSELCLIHSNVIDDDCYSYIANFQLPVHTFISSTTYATEKSVIFISEL